MKKLIVLLFLILFSAYSYAADIEGNRATLRGVDKITGHTGTSKIVVGKPTEFNGMRITVERCLKKPPEETPENAAFIFIEEEKNKAYQVVFRGWMFSSNPALSAMEHPIYDIWLLSCELEETPNPDGQSEQKENVEMDNTVSVETLPTNLSVDTTTPQTENTPVSEEVPSDLPEIIED